MYGDFASIILKYWETPHYSKSIMNKHKPWFQVKIKLDFCHNIKKSKGSNCPMIANHVSSGMMITDFYLSAYSSEDFNQEASRKNLSVHHP